MHVHDCLAVCPPGLEELVADEWRELRLRPGKPIHGGVPFRATDRELYLANVWTRLATRVIVRLGTFVAKSFAELEARAASLPWDLYLTDGITPVFRVTAAKSKLYHTDAIAERLHRVTGTTPVIEDDEHTLDPDRVQLFVVRFSHDKVTISVDSSGESLHRRGWRQQVAKAPLRETLAAAMVRASGWTGHTPLVDPLCGSGTIAIEGALAACGYAPGANRTFAFQRWASFQPGTWASVNAGVIKAATDRVRRRDVPPIIAADRDAGAARATLANAERAGVADLIQVRNAALSLTISSLTTLDFPGLLLTNPPYGERIGERGPRSGAGVGGQRDLRDLYAALGTAVREQLPGWSLGLLVSDMVLAGQVRLPLVEKFATSNGGIDVSMVTYDPGS
ncbi:MAG: class I SAM-dependent RNA methyltransferase [Actinobacteria bacterium]|uniref:Unannotated protein n=1 Tax=freshwater metagenome TaxID=449393 RepID=A0A6J7AI95_9ZZZZ|nr:class I SAM-dependent RNA methyltransferase [Actinomycetota bacterium]MSW90439.1 class I SAM-dependent RNA methyltransferase [Actinomycetota bacterium]MSX87360.1 class I SAM-dependent RNA methyltransferase [Actinomycetota bacterium]MSY71958.1 class I SAM-dependent RNA methyltransferase [Actinomycetota bacterium]